MSSPAVILIDENSESEAVLRGWFKDVEIDLRCFKRVRRGMAEVHRRQPVLVVVGIDTAKGADACANLKVNPKLKDIVIVAVSSGHSKSSLYTHLFGGYPADYYVRRPVGSSFFRSLLQRHLGIVLPGLESERLKDRQAEAALEETIELETSPQFRNEVQQLRQQMGELGTELIQAKARVLEVEGSLFDQQENQRRLDDALGRIEHLESQTRDLNEEIGEKVSSLENATGSLQNAEQRIAQLEESEAKVEELHGLMEAAHAELDAKRTQLAELETQRETLDSELEQANAAIADGEKQVGDLHAALEAARLDAESESTEATEKIAALEEQLATSRSSLEAAEERAAGLGQEQERAHRSRGIPCRRLR